ncbi:MAG: hypothetical protein HRT90_08865 [Candidatus Margulisbacteria bacterium]|nr:hypothetical protein [Candidatus Margulisiibacteriota bacterium]
MSDKEVFAWQPSESSEGLPLGIQVVGNHLSESVFAKGLPIDEAYEKWLGFKGVQAALKGAHRSEGQDYTDEVKRTIEWMKHKPPLQYISSWSKEKLEKNDVLNLSLSVPFGSQKMIQILEEICPNDFEAFPVKLHTSTGVSDKYYLINITHVIHDAIDKKNSVYTIWFNKNEGEENSVRFIDRLLFKQDCMEGKFLGRIHEKLRSVAINKKVMDLFHANNIKGMGYVSLEDKINSLFTDNYELDGVTLKY